MKRYELEANGGWEGAIIVEREDESGEFVRADDAQARIAELEARIKDLTEWRPMSKAPNGTRILTVNSSRLVTVSTLEGHGGFPPEMVTGWLPLPEAK